MAYILSIDGEYMGALLSGQDSDHIHNIFEQLSDHAGYVDLGDILSGPAGSTSATLPVTFNTSSHAEFYFSAKKGGSRFGLRAITFGKYTDLDLVSHDIYPEARIQFYNDSEFSQPWDQFAPIDAIVTIERMRYMQTIVDKMAKMLEGLGEEENLI